MLAAMVLFTCSTGTSSTSAGSSRNSSTGANSISYNSTGASNTGVICGYKELILIRMRDNKNGGEINTVNKMAFTLFCHKFVNVVNRAFWC